MRICYLSADRGIPVNGFKGGAAHIRGVVRAFLELGHTVTLVAPGAGDPLLSVSGARFVSIPQNDVTAHLLDRVKGPVARALAHVWNNTGVETVLPRSWNGSAPDFLYERLSPFGIAGSVVARRHGIFHVLEVNAPLAWEGARYRNQSLSEAAEVLEAEALASVSLIVTVSQELRDLLVERGVDSGKTVVVPNGVDTALFCPEPAKDDVPRRDDGIVVGFVGSLKPWHGVDVLAEAFRRLAGDPRYHLLVVGTGPESRLVARLVEDHPGRVTWVQGVPHEEVPLHLRKMDIAVVPYPDLEAFYFSPLKVLEYMASGRAIVASALGQLRHLIDDGRNGVLVPPGDPAALAAALRDLADDPARRTALGREARSSALCEHRWRDRAAAIVEAVEAARC